MAVQKLCTRKHKSVLEICSELGISSPTLYKWRGEFEDLGKKGIEKLEKPQSRSPQEKLQHIIDFSILENHDKGEYLRIRGITENHLEEWKKQMKDSLSSKSSYKQKITQSADKRRIKELESESVKQRPLLAATHLRTTHAAFAACSSSLYKA